MSNSRQFDRRVNNPIESPVMPVQLADELPYLESNAEGQYLSAFLHLHLKITDDILGLNLISSSEPPYWTDVFLHEYVHFLQGVTTTFGLRQFITMVDYLKAAASDTVVERGVLKKDAHQTAIHGNPLSNSTLMPLYIGQVTRLTAHQLKDFQFGEIVLESGPVIKVDGQSITTTKFVINYTVSSLHPPMRRVEFGALHLEEYMAHAQSVFILSRA